MCGRYRLTKRRMLEIEDYYGVDEVTDLEMWKREFNIPPREMAPAVLEAHGKRRLTAGLWSLMGPWADSLEHANRASTFNAKAETLTERSAYRNAFLRRRCVVPAEAFYEWVGPKKERQPLNIARADGKLLSIAGLFNYWKPANSQGRPMLTFTVVTTDASRWMARIHNRMPVILQHSQIDTWLDPAVSDPQQLGELLKAPPEDFLDCYPVSRRVSSVKFDEPECAERIDMDYRVLLKNGSEPSAP
jgi:putative SOS response-associated peptidase YedK